jgi:ferritin-like metal-binding protein YciE
MSFFTLASERFVWRLAGQEPTNREGGVLMAASAKGERVGAEVEEKLVKHIDEAYAMEQNVLRMLDGMISSTEDAEMRRELEQHKRVTEQQAERLEKRLEAHDASPSAIKEAGGILGALMKGAVDMARSDKAGRNARDGFATEHMEIASYELLERVAKRAGDSETAAVARQNRKEEREMARKISANWDKVVELTLSDK